MLKDGEMRGGYQEQSRLQLQGRWKVLPYLQIDIG